MSTSASPTTVVASLFAALILLTDLRATPLVTIDTVTVGHAGNAADTNGFGAVAEVFAIGRYEVSLSQYSTFLNAVAATDTYNLYNPNMGSNANIAGISRSGTSGSYSYSVMGSGSRPVSYVSWFDAARFANWMNNGATGGASTETGAYTLGGATNGVGFTKNAGATWWIPSGDQWYKAAYYDPSPAGPAGDDYWWYPTRSDATPGNVVGGGTNQANLHNDVYSVTQSWWPDPNQNFLTEGGSYSNSASFYGTFDQGGNVFEWNDGVSNASRGLRGGAWNSQSLFLHAETDFYTNPDAEWPENGFRVASVPEPSTYALLALAAACLGGYVLRRRRAERLP